MPSANNHIGEPKCKKMSLQDIYGEMGESLKVIEPQNLCGKNFGFILFYQNPCQGKLLFFDKKMYRNRKCTAQKKTKFKD